MDVNEALRLIHSAGFEPPPHMEVQAAEGSTCPCGEGIWLVSHRGEDGMGFEPGFYVCAACKRVAKIGEPVPVPAGLSAWPGVPRAGNSGEVVVSVEFLTGSVGTMDPRTALEAIARKLHAALVEHQQGRGHLGTFAIRLAGATYEPFKGADGPTVRVEWSEDAALPPTGEA
ncbi:MAG TPA: hypothetical protein VMZ50_08360 [Phycisphaerae bacterium]|nr:hypothetical protein [Phycisphaerae bacterium]